MIEFEALSERGRAEVRKSDEFKEIKKYYDQCQEVWQHNIAEHAWRMRIGAEPIGKVEYLPGTYVFPIHPPSPIEFHWIKDPERDFRHKPNCPYAMSNWDENKKIICCKREEKKENK